MSNFPLQALFQQPIIQFQTSLHDLLVIGSESRIFMTFPRFRAGIPVTLGVRSSKKSADGSPLIAPYPDYSWHANPTQDCDNRMISVFRIAVSRFWLMEHSTNDVELMANICSYR
jgi:hypothetical protein